MKPIAQSGRPILVIANRTCPYPTLAPGRASAAPTDVLVVAPALNARLRVLGAGKPAARIHWRAPEASWANISASQRASGNCS